MKWIFLIAYTLCVIGFIVASVHDDVQHMVLWGFFGIVDYIALKAEEVKEAVGH